MSRIVLFVAREEMLYQAHNILQEKKFELQESKVIRTDAAVAEARRVISEGAELIIARGLQATLIKRYTNIPVVDIVMTAQEMALLIMRAKQIVKKPYPVIAVVGNYNMFCNMSFFDELYQIRLQTYYVHGEGELLEEAQRAASDHVDIVIGGDIAVRTATEAGIPSLFLSTTEDSMRQAFMVAESMIYAMHAEKTQAAKMETVLDSSFNGMMQLNGDGIVTAANPMIGELLNKPQEDLISHNIREVIPAISEAVLNNVLKQGKECSAALDHPKNPIFAVLTPIFVDGRVEGAVLTCQKIRQTPKAAPQQEEKKKNAQSVRGLPAFSHFSNIRQQSEAMQECVRYARLYALSDKPIVIRGETGTEKRMLAECMHNVSERAKEPFLDVPCEGQSGIEQRDMIFGEKGAVFMAQGGTLLIHNFEGLTEDNQYRLYQLLQFHLCRGSDISTLRRADVRIMVTVRKPLSVLRGEGKISPELFYLLSGLELYVPPLRKRREDLRGLLEDTIRERSERYGRYHTVTAGAKKLLSEYPWYGNLFQIEHFCDRLILTVGKRSIDEVAVRGLLRELYPEEQEHGDGGVLSQDVEWSGGAADVVEALRKCGGNREMTAQQLGISKATLWRRIKKYGIDFKKLQ